MKSHEMVTARSDRFDHEDFDRLLEESSLSTTAAKKNQRETPIGVYRYVQDYLRDSEVACRQVDVDDFLLDLVRLYSVSRDTKPQSSTPASTTFSTRFWTLWTPRNGFQWRRDGDFACHVRADVVPGVMQTLLDKEVFSYLRQDVARSLVSLCFTSRTPLPLAILSACASAVPASSLRDEIADAFMTIMRTARTRLPADSWLKRPDEQDTIYHAGLRARRQPQQTLTMTRPVEVTAPPPQPRDQRSTTDLLLRACDRDPKAWEAIVRRYSGVVLATVRSFKLQDDDVLDAVQTTWLRLAENCHRIQFPDHLGGWLATTASRECLRILRHQAPHAPTPPDAAAQQAADPSVGPEQHAVDADTEARLWSLVATLPPDHRALIQELVATNPRPYAEAARAIGIPTGAIGPTRARALRQLRRRLTWDTRLRLVVLQDPHDDKIQEVVISQHGQPLATASNDSTTQIEDTRNDNELVVVHDQEDQIQVKVWSPEEQWFTSALNDYTPWILVSMTTASSTTFAVPSGHDDKIREVAEDDNEFWRQASEHAARLLWRSERYQRRPREDGPWHNPWVPVPVAATGTKDPWIRSEGQSRFPTLVVHTDLTAQDSKPQPGRTPDAWR